uniref:Uncharacterized protein n=1 Tax=Arundo donax TaxID=35708 RepID=A0A0A8ZTI7_ARUDO
MQTVYSNNTVKSLQSN